MTIEEAIAHGAQELSGVGLEEPRAEAEFLLAELMQAQRPKLLFDRKKLLPAAVENLFAAGLIERRKRKPLAYIVESSPFLDMTLRVTPDVLIPRPETEMLAEKMWAELDLSKETKNVVVDVGTGSGNLLLALLRHSSVLRGIGLDVSSKALKVALENAAKGNPGKETSWVESDLLENYSKREEAVWLVANLPYIRRNDLSHLEPELSWEPRSALDGGVDGLELIFRLIDQSGEKLSSGSVIWLESGYDQGPVIEEYLGKKGQWIGIRVEKDLAGWPRFVRAQRS